MQVTVNSTVSYNVNKAEIREVCLNRVGSDVTVRADVSWLDANGISLNRKDTRLTATQIKAINAEAAAVVAALTTLIPETRGTTMILQLHKDIPSLYVWGPHTVDGKDVWSKTVITDADLVAKGISMEIVLNTVSGLVVALTK